MVGEAGVSKVVKKKTVIDQDTDEDSDGDAKPAKRGKLTIITQVQSSIECNH